MTSLGAQEDRARHSTVKTRSTVLKKSAENLSDVEFFK
jgi:hypothetical protein